MAWKERLRDRVDWTAVAVIGGLLAAIVGICLLQAWGLSHEKL